MMALKECLFVLAVSVYVSAYIEDDIKELTETNLEMFQYLQMQQYYMEERIRADGNSGIKQLRKFLQGTKAYHSESHTGLNLFAIHNHADHYHTSGMGEVVAVLNGVEFRTRHNDFYLRQPHPTDSSFGATQDIPYPEVPPAVAAKATPEEQIEEMTLWFKAWKDQDYSVRDYRPYFKPLLCYLEGAWSVLEDDKVRELASSDRHTLRAATWPELSAKIRFMAASGAKHQAEDYAFLPSTILDMENDTIPVFGQWNYRILCHQIKRDLQFNRFRLQDDITARLPRNHDMDKYRTKNAARFSLCPTDTDDCGSDGFYDFELIDELMAEIPGMNNYGADITETIYGVPSLDFRTGQTLNAAYYHRFFKSKNVGVEGTKNRRRSFSDDNIYMAMTTHTEIGSTGQMYQCMNNEDGPSCRSKSEQRWTYAIPIEVIYVTPIHKWNPYDIAYYGYALSDEGRGTTSNGRNGGLTSSTAYNGTNSENYYITPSSFFSGGEINKDSADTTDDATGVLDKNHVVRRTSASGVRVFLPNIPGVGVIRTRYPIAPIHGEGTAVWKEIDALEDLVKGHCEKGDLFPSRSPYNRDTVTFVMAMGDTVEAEGVTNHTHSAVLTHEQTTTLKNGWRLFVNTSVSDFGPPHSHNLEGRYLLNEGKLVYYNCDGQKYCEHDKTLMILEGMDN